MIRMAETIVMHKTCVRRSTEKSVNKTNTV